MKTFRGLVKWDQGEGIESLWVEVQAEDADQARDAMVAKAVTHLTEEIWGFEGGIVEDGFTVSLLREV